MELTLRGAILQVFPSATAFGKAMGWSRQKASNIMNGRVSPDAEEMMQIARGIGVEDSGTFLRLFFPHVSTK